MPAHINQILIPKTTKKIKHQHEDHFFQKRCQPELDTHSPQAKPGRQMPGTVPALQVCNKWFNGLHNLYNVKIYLIYITSMSKGFLPDTGVKTPSIL